MLKLIIACIWTLMVSLMIGISVSKDAGLSVLGVLTFLVGVYANHLSNTKE
jgi:hypothetical protein